MIVVICIEILILMQKTTSFWGTLSADPTGGSVPQCGVRKMLRLTYANIPVKSQRHYHDWYVSHLWIGLCVKIATSNWYCNVMCLCSNGRQKRAKRYATDAELTERLWSISTDLCKLSTTWHSHWTCSLNLAIISPPTALLFYACYALYAWG